MAIASSTRPVLVTGANRSGTTWVGQVLCQSGELEYLHEPFNSALWPRLLDAHLGGHYRYVHAPAEPALERAVERMLRYRFPVRHQVTEVRTPRDAARFGRDWARSVHRRLRHRRPLVKDPIALFAAEWLADTFDMDVVVMIRHPAAFASSIKRLRWSFDFDYWARQPELLHGYLAPVADDVRAAATRTLDHVDQAILLWRAFYVTVDGLRDRRPSWHFIRYEDLAGSPAALYADLYRSLGLHHDEEVAARIWSFSDESNVKDVPSSDIGTVRRDSSAARSTWLGRLTPEEIERVHRGVADVADRFYDETDWNPSRR